MEQKRAIAKKFYLNNRNWQQTTREANISDGLLRYWLADEDINPDRDYAKKLRSRLKVKLAERNTLCPVSRKIHARKRFGVNLDLTESGAGD